MKAHRTKKEKENMSQFEQFVTEGNETADDLAKAGASVGRRTHVMAEARAKTMQQEKRGGVCSIAVMRPTSTA